MKFEPPNIVVAAGETANLIYAILYPPPFLRETPRAVTKIPDGVVRAEKKITSKVWLSLLRVLSSVQAQNGHRRVYRLTRFRHKAIRGASPGVGEAARRVGYAFLAVFSTRERE